VVDESFPIRSGVIHIQERDRGNKFQETVALGNGSLLEKLVQKETTTCCYANREQGIRNQWDMISIHMTRMY
jgi:hypothetical protein